jgi:hypothetical protein
MDSPDIYPNIAELYARKVSRRLAESLRHPDDRIEAADAVRGGSRKSRCHPGTKLRTRDEEAGVWVAEGANLPDGSGLATGAATL